MRNNQFIDTIRFSPQSLVEIFPKFVFHFMIILKIYEIHDCDKNLGELKTIFKTLIVSLDALGEKRLGTNILLLVHGRI